MTLICEFLLYSLFIFTRCSTEIAQKSNAFGLELYQQLSESVGSKKNVIFSPYSMFSVLNMVLAGAEGNTRTEMLDVLKHVENPSVANENKEVHSLINELTESLMDVANISYLAHSIFLKENETLLDEFVQTLEEYYDSEARNVKFEEPGRTVINEWVEEKTNGFIKEFIQEGVLTEYTYSVLVNTIYYRNSWAYQFNEEKTQVTQFALIDEILSKGSHKVDMMYMDETDIYLGSGNGYRTGSLYYYGENEVNKRYKMIFVVPTKNTQEAFDAVEKSISENAENFVDEVLENEELENGEIRIPKFEIETESSDYVDFLNTMGMKDLFDRSACDLSRMSLVSLFVTEVIQKAKITLNEEGTEAGAASGVIFEPTSAPVYYKKVGFNLHQPFLYYLVDTDSGLILFNGKVMEPNEAVGEIEVHIMDYGAANTIIYSIMVLVLILLVL